MMVQFQLKQSVRSSQRSDINHPILARENRGKNVSLIPDLVLLVHVPKTHGNLLDLVQIAQIVNPKSQEIYQKKNVDEVDGKVDAPRRVIFIKRRGA
eukprot:snap_masked-scaffold_33-processed-gene-0.38-mRNA-1 protein AED:1.00 eAED:1.00 QI:0/0/0/0/1/1/4/0/96